MMLERYSPKKMKAELRKKASDVVSFAESIPRRATKLVMELESAHKDLININTTVGRLSSEIDKSSNRVTLGFLSGTLLIASSFLLPYDKTRLFGVPAMAFMGYAVAFLIIIAIFISMLREKKL
jgi:ubiquinone biosynthesis protein